MRSTPKRALGLDASAIPDEEWQRTYDEEWQRTYDEEWQRTYGDAYRPVAIYLEWETVIFDRGNFSRSERDQVREIARRTGSEVHSFRPSQR